MRAPSGQGVGRRKVYIGLCLTSFAACTFLFHAFHGYSVPFVIASGVVGFTSSSFYGWLPQYLPELFPTRVRATGQGVCYNFGRILTALSAWKVSSLMGVFHNSYPHAGEAVVLIYFIGIVGILFLPETHGQPLPD